MPNENYFNPGIQYKQMGWDGGLGVYGNVGYTSQDQLAMAQAKKLKFDQDMASKRFDMLHSLFGQQQQQGSGSASFFDRPPPRPSYLNAGPVWSQGQIDAQAGLQRSNLLTQANDQTNRFATSLASRGFSPSGSPFLNFAGMNNMMKANAGAAENETQLNFNAAKANSDARLQAGGINAGMYGDWVKSMMGYDSAHMDYDLKRRGMQNDIFRQLIGGLAG